MPVASLNVMFLLILIFSLLEGTSKLIFFLTGVYNALIFIVKLKLKVSFN